MSENRLPIEAMIQEAKDNEPSDLSCHVYALVDEIRKLSEAATVAYRHLDTYGVATGGHERELAGQIATFNALRPFTVAVGDIVKPLYPMPIDETPVDYMPDLRRKQAEHREADQYTQIYTAELKVDVYGGDSCEEHVPYWDAYAEGDKDGDRSKEPIVLKLELFPVGTTVTVEAPVCPECGRDVQLCQADEDCDFDWKQWAEDRYS